MQTKILLSLVMFFLSFAASAQLSFTSAGDAGQREKEISFSVSVVPDKKTPAFRLHVYNPAQKKIELQISHKVNGVVVDTSFAVTEFSRRYNFEQADDGRYLVILVSGKERVIKTVDINTITTRNVVID